ncbi:hypothetical protein AFL01nite_15460 [Aeromicrobium flavum]|uniref:Uncharacterized protein n=1 Tax=Aeromicrobium flavum TaxID=416568 RepID=A0A512HUT6_9ACTN|nr:hypothetical protein [Aeromicrobium flavum]GEO89219.1 hypothetical protein AFL01nite_15460 [Aeromicrobium flavum]
MEQLSPPERRGYRRITVGVILVLLALGLFPSTAAVLDEANEDLILPLFVAVMVVAGMLLWSLVPGLSDGSRSRGHLVAVGAVAGLVSAGVAIAVFYALLNGYSGA